MVRDATGAHCLRPVIRAVAVDRDYRDAYRCALCPRGAEEVDHIVPVAEGGSDNLSNLRSLCHNCHASR